MFQFFCPSLHSLTSINSLLPPLLRVFHNLPPTSPCPITAPLAHVIHSLITIPVTPTLRSTWLDLQSTSGNSASPRTESLSRTSTSLNIDNSYDVLQHAYDLFEDSFSHYFPGNTDPDDPEIRTRCKAESSDNLDDMLSPLVVLITKLCIADEESRTRVQHWIVPEDLDRSSPLEERSDITGKCLRLLSCVYHPQLKDAVGELLFAIADSDGRIFILFP